MKTVKQFLLPALLCGLALYFDTVSWDYLGWFSGGAMILALAFLYIDWSFVHGLQMLGTPEGVVLAKKMGLDTELDSKRLNLKFGIIALVLCLIFEIDALVLFWTVMSVFSCYRHFSHLSVYVGDYEVKDLIPKKK